MCLGITNTTAPLLLSPSIQLSLLILAKFGSIPLRIIASAFKFDADNNILITMANEDVLELKIQPKQILLWKRKFIIDCVIILVQI